MTTALGGLAVYLGLDAADFTRGLTDAEVKAQRGAKAIALQIGLVAGAAAEAASQLIGFASAAPQYFKGFVAGAAALDDFAERTGVSVEEASKLEQTLLVSGNAITELLGPLDKLAKGLTGVDDETKGAGRALEVLGVNARDSTGKLRDSGAILQDVAKALTGYEDGAGKSAAAQALFGKSGSALVPILKDLAEAGEVNATTTAEQAARADEFEKAARKLGIALDNSLRAVVLESLPSFTALKKSLFETALQMVGLGNASGDLASNKSVAEWAKSVGTAITYFIVDPIDLAVRLFKVAGSFIGAQAAAIKETFSGNRSGAKEISDAFFADAKAILNAPTASQRFLKNLEEAQRSVAIATGEVKKSLDPSKFGIAAEKIKKVKEEANDLAKLLEKINGKQQGTDADFISNLKLLKVGLDTGRLSLEEYNNAANAYVNQQQYMKDQVKALSDEQQRQIDLVKQGVDSYNKLTESLADQLQTIEDETALIGANADARKLLVAQRELERKGIVEGTALWDEYGKKIIEATEAQILANTAQEQAVKRFQETNAQADMVIDRLTDIAQNGSDAMKRLGDDIQRYLIKTLLELTLKKWIIDISAKSSGGRDLLQQILGSAFNAIFGGGSDSGSSGSTGDFARMDRGAGYGTGDLALAGYTPPAFAKSSGHGGNTYIYNVGSQVSRGEVLTGLQQARTAAVSDVKQGLARNAPGLRG
jgi:hypothetical protein